jgi:hypothetical protein
MHGTIPGLLHQMRKRLPQDSDLETPEQIFTHGMR